MPEEVAAEAAWARVLAGRGTAEALAAVMVAALRKALAVLPSRAEM